MTKAECPKKRPRLIGYARVSTKKQRLEQQVIALQEAGCDAIYKDKGVSGKTARRKGLDAAIRSSSEGDTLIVYKLDRLGRSLLNLERLRHKLERKGVVIRSLSQSTDCTTASGKLVFQIFAAFAEFESNLNGERTKGGMQARKAHGAQFGRPAKLSQEDAQTIQRMLTSPEMTMAKAARIFEVSSNTIKRALDRLEDQPA